MCLGLDCAFFFIWNYAQHSSSGTRSLLTLRKASLKKKLQGSLLKKRFRTKQGRHSFCHQYKVFISIRLKLMLLGKRLLESDISTHLSWERQKKSYWVHCWHCSKKPFRICILNSTANPANFHPHWAGLAVLFSRQILNGSQVIFSP